MPPCQIMVVQLKISNLPVELNSDVPKSSHMPQPNPELRQTVQASSGIEEH
jgi:hypothetical protein